MKEIFRLPSKGTPNVLGLNGTHIITTTIYDEFSRLFPDSNRDVFETDRVPYPHKWKGFQSDHNQSIDGHTAALSAEFLMKEEQETTQRLQEWIQSSDNKPTVFLPFVGEFGWRLMWHVPVVHLSTASYKIVCCYKGQEVLYPSADEFFYDWEDKTPDYLKAGTTRMTYDWSDIRNRFRSIDSVWTDKPNRWHFMDPQLSIEDECYAAKLPLINFKLIPRILRNLTVDVVIATRNRSVQPDKNYPHFQIIADFLTSQNLTFATLGGPPTSPRLIGAEYYSGQFHDLDGAVELLQNCKLFIGIDSGGAHLAALIGCCPMLVQQVNTQHRQFIDAMVKRTPHTITTVPFREWNNPGAIIWEIERILNLKKG